MDSKNSMIKIKMNFKCLLYSTLYKSFMATFFTLIYLYIDFIIPTDDDKIFLSIVVNVLVLGYLWIYPTIYFVNYYLNSRNRSFVIDMHSKTMLVKSRDKETTIPISEILKITKVHDVRLYYTNFYGFFYYDVKTTNDSFCISMFMTWKLEKILSEVPFESIPATFPLIKRKDFT